MLQQNNQVDQLSLILAGVYNPDANIRKQAEDQVKLFFSQNFGQFLIELSKKISTEQENMQVRQVSATLIKNAINEAKYTEEWFKLSEDIKKIIKDNILSTLASNNVNVRKAAALALAGICKVEIPKGQWLNIFDVLSNTAQNPDLNIQLSSLTTLEYIYEEIKRGDIPNNIVAQLLNTYYSLLSKENINPQLAINALNSILKFLPFINDFIGDANSKIKFYDLIEKFIRDGNEEIRRITLQIFLEIGKIYYDSLQDYIEKIFKFTEIIIENDVESNKVLALEIWYNIGLEEDYRKNEININKRPSHNYLERYNLQLGNMCLKYIVTENYDSKDEDSTINTACFRLILIMSRCCEYGFLSNMITYIGNNINNATEKMKYSALNVFRAIVCTVHRNQFYDVVKNSLPTISQILLNNAPSHFKVLCANIIKSISSNFHEQLTNDTVYFDKMIMLYLELFKVSTKEVLYILIVSLNNLVKSIQWSESDETNILSKYMQRLCEPLVNICSNVNLCDKECNIISVTFYLLGTLGERSALDIKIQMTNLFALLANMFQKTLNSTGFPSEEICNNYQEYLAACLTGFLTTEKAEKNTAAVLLNDTLKSFEKRKGLYDEGITLIGAISLFTNKDFNTVMPVISPYLINGLNSHDSPSICRASICCLSDIVRALESNNNYVNDFLPLIMNILSDNNINQECKPLCFNIISDLFIYCPNEAFKSFENIMKVIGGAIEATKTTFNEASDPETVRYFVTLREHIMETVTCVFSAVKDIQKTKEFIPYVKNIVNYINIICNDYANSIEIINGGLCLIADFCVSYGNDIKPLLNTILIQDMFNKIENDKEVAKNLTIKEGIIWAKNAINSIYINGS